MRVQLLAAHNFAMAGGAGSIALSPGSIIGPAVGDFPIGNIANFAATSGMLGLDSAGVAAVASAGGPRAPFQSFATTLATSATTAAGAAVLTFASVPAAALLPQPGCGVSNLTTPSVIPPNTSLLSKTATTITLSANATGAGIGSGDVVLFGGLIPPTWAGPIPAYFGGTGPNYANA